MSILTNINAYFNYIKAGHDQYGNKYYKSAKINANTGQNTRMVIYNGLAEPSKIPPAWHSWLHYLVDQTPSSAMLTYSWQKAHLPNLTATKMARFPSGHFIYAKDRDKVSSDYQAWNPNSIEAYEK